MSAETIVFDLVKNVTSRVYRQNSGQNPILPFLEIHLLSSGHDHVLGGPAGVFNGVFQCDAVSRDMDECISIIEDIRQILDGYSDNNVVYSTILDENSEAMPPKDGSHEWLYTKQARYSIRIRETI